MHASVVANSRVAVEPARPTIWNGRLSLSLVILGVANSTPSIILRKSVCRGVFIHAVPTKESRSGSISGTLTVMPLKTLINRVISSGGTGWSVLLFQGYQNLQEIVAGKGTGLPWLHSSSTRFSMSEWRYTHTFISNNHHIQVRAWQSSPTSLQGLQLRCRGISQDFKTPVVWF